jgi:hypothetical protein
MSDARNMRETELFGHEKFVCYWRTGMDDHVVEIHDADFFKPDNGYSEDDIETLANLLISESADLSFGAIGQQHYVLRVY